MLDNSSDQCMRRKGGCYEKAYEGGFQVWGDYEGFPEEEKIKLKVKDEKHILCDEKESSGRENHISKVPWVGGDLEFWGSDSCAGTKGRVGGGDCEMKQVGDEGRTGWSKFRFWPLF